MHICPDEIAPVLTVLGIVPFACRWCWAKARVAYHRLRGNRIPRATVVRRRP